MMNPLTTSILLLGFWLASFPAAHALDLCSHGPGGSDCGNGTFTCNAGYNVNCRQNCTFDAGCSDICDTCACIPGYKPADFETVLSGAGNAKNIIAYCNCKNVKNEHSASKTLFVPLKTSNEWTTFFNNAPAGVTVGPGSCE